MKITINIFLFSILLNLSLSAQTEGIQTDNIEVFKNFEANLDDAKKVEIVPKLPKIDPVKKVYNYKITILPLQIKYPDPIIKPLAMPQDQPFESHDFYAKLGYGNLKSPYAKILYGKRDYLKYDLNFDLSYYGIDNSAKVDLQKMSDLNARVNGKYRVKENMQLFGGINTNIQSRYLYFTPEASPENEASLKRKLTDLSLFGGIKNVEETETGVNYFAKLALSSFKITQASESGNESTMNFKASIDKRLTEKINVEFPLQLDYTSNKNASPNSNILTLEIVPKINFHIGKFSASAGVSVINDTYAKVNLYPSIELAYGIIGNFVQVFANADQKYYSNRYQNLTKENPYLNLDLSGLRNTIDQSISGGLRGEFSFITYQGRGGYKKVQSQALYINTFGKYATPTVIFDDLNAVFVSGNIEFAAAKYVRVGGVMTKNFYTLHTLDKPYALPSLDLNAYAKFLLLQEKLSITGDLNIADRVDANKVLENGISEVITLNNQVELNATAEFWPIKNAGIYLQANNILNNKYARYYGYPSVGINFNGGVVLKF